MDSVVNKESMWKQYKCAEYKAKHFVELLNNPPCLQNTYQYNPYFWEYHIFCLSGPLTTLSLLLLFILLLIFNL
jgi:hypothetical protein